MFGPYISSSPFGALNKCNKTGTFAMGMQGIFFIKIHFTYGCGTFFFIFFKQFWLDGHLIGLGQGISKV